MSESPSVPAPLSSGHIDRIRQDALRGIGASSGDTVRLVRELIDHKADIQKLGDALATVVSAQAEALIAGDYSELQARAEAANAVTGNVKVELSITSAEGSSREEINAVTLFYGLATPAALLGLIDDLCHHKAKCQILAAQVVVLQSDANSWQSGYARGRRMATKLSLAARKHLDRYLWLRRRDLNSIQAGGVFAGMTPNNVVLNGKDLDKAIDDAMGRGAQS